MKRKPLPKSPKLVLTPEQLEQLRKDAAIEDEFPYFMIGSRNKVWPSDFPKEWHPRADDGDPLLTQVAATPKRKAKKRATPARN